MSVENGDTERRKFNRTAAINRSVLIETEGYTGFCLLRDLSPAGMMGVAHTQFLAGEPVSIQFLPGHIVAGSIIWSRDEKVGIEFKERVDLAGAMDAIGGQYVESQFNRYPRVQLDWRTTAAVGNANLGVIVQDASQFGARIRMPFVEPGASLRLELRGTMPRSGIVRWSQRDVCGVKFDHPLAFRELANLAVECRSGSAQGRAGRRGA